MCRDCHSAVKYFSILTKREIVVRDRKRLHRFRDGRCCCGILLIEGVNCRFHSS
ncbi:Pentatricopeptide repeat-containing protein [Dendrobium catenatum]|uniref:Pentatricopeptide repeat-containing protein n=2 Tax=Dendrobium catenatum TaxID=906689 RepID=A0A2I0VH85_9ASPA|nr:Pentatricopeptide repeat-containing protein [Dendrobium catenatum]PKU87959.1 Pentatricopeptide repeat-containing protein [Dendrobium catenatum]